MMVAFRHSHAGGNPERTMGMMMHTSPFFAEKGGIQGGFVQWRKREPPASRFARRVPLLLSQKGEGIMAIMVQQHVESPFAERKGARGMLGRGRDGKTSCPSFPHHGNHGSTARRKLPPSHNVRGIGGCSSPCKINPVINRNRLSGGHSRDDEPQHASASSSDAEEDPADARRYRRRNN